MDRNEWSLKLERGIGNVLERALEKEVKNIGRGRIRINGVWRSWEEIEKKGGRGKR